MKHKVEGPTPLTIGATKDGAEIGLASALRPLFLELFADADNDPETFAETFTDMHSLAQAAQRGGADCHARHEFDERLDRMLDQYANGGAVEVYAGGLAQLLAAVREIAAPRPVPGQRGAA